MLFLPDLYSLAVERTRVFWDDVTHCAASSLGNFNDPAVCDVLDALDVTAAWCACIVLVVLRVRVGKPS